MKSWLREINRREINWPAWAMVIVSITAMIITCDKMGDQVTVMKAQNEAFLNVAEQASRPFLLFADENVGAAGFWYRMGPSDSTNAQSNVSRQLAEVPLSSTLYKSVSRVIVGLEDWSIRIQNTGKRPLYVHGIMCRGLTKDEWVSEFSKNVEKLCEWTARMREFGLLETDYIIMPDSSRIYRDQDPKRTIDPGVFETKMRSEQDILFYPYIYVQYKDTYDNTYDAIYMVMCRFSSKTQLSSDSALIAAPVLEQVVIEKLQWDILYKPGEL